MRDVAHHIQAGFGLLELMLVMVISAAILLLGLRQYGVYQQYTWMDAMKQSASALLDSAGDYYKEHCITDLTSDAQYTDATQAFTVVPESPQLLLPTEISPDISLKNYFGSTPLQAFLFVTSSQPNRFGATWLWHEEVSVCITDATLVKSAQSNPQLLRGLFGADNVTVESQGAKACTKGIVLTWERLPSNDGNTAGANSQWLMKAAMREDILQNEFGSWMLQSNSGIHQERLNYLCQA